MSSSYYLSAVLMGFLGSFHCAGMCGPIAMMLPRKSDSKSVIIISRLIYNSGRVLTYVVIGLFFGMLGLAIAMRGFQRELSVFTGVLILLLLLLTSGKKERLKMYSVTTGYTNPLRRKIKKLFSNPSYTSLFLIGVINGLLPCGFVYLAIAGASATGSITGGILYMALFGLGTFPVMMLISLASGFLGIRFRKIFSKITPFISIALALLLIYRGTDMKTDECCKKEKIHSSISAEKTHE